MFHCHLCVTAMTLPSLQDLLEFFWTDYTAITPSAAKIYGLLTERNENYVNDHIAFRTFNIDPISVESLGATFLALGYEPSGEYHFEAKKLRALSYAHPDPAIPHIFISELLVEEFSPELQEIVRGLVAQIPAELKGKPELLTMRPTWNPIAYADYVRLLEESEYAGWLATFGIRVNHFTVLINALQSFPTLESFNDWLLASGFQMNRSGGLIKGTPGQLLEQSSTMADRVMWDFANGEQQMIPTCYHEFARRYTDPATGELYTGFVAKSADKIFESTDSRAAEN